jgi:hypothetical protein
MGTGGKGGKGRKDKMKEEMTETRKEDERGGNKGRKIFLPPWSSSFISFLPTSLLPSKKKCKRKKKGKKERKEG